MGLMGRVRLQRRISTLVLRDRSPAAPPVYFLILREGAETFTPRCGPVSNSFCTTSLNGTGFFLAPSDTGRFPDFLALAIPLG